MGASGLLLMRKGWRTGGATAGKNLHGGTLYHQLCASAVSRLKNSSSEFVDGAGNWADVLCAGILHRALCPGAG